MTITVHFATMATTVQPPLSLTTWSRLEVQPTSPDYTAALEARTADPLWFMARQWQFGEFNAEDAGTPIEVKLAGEHTSLSRFHAGAFGKQPATAAMDYDPARLPLEALVEAEDPAATGPLFGAIAGRQFQRLLAGAGVADPISGRPEFAAKLPADIDRDLDPDGAAWAAILDGRAVDGHALAAAIAAAGGVPAGVAATDALKAVCLEWLDWYRGGIGAERPSSWLPQRLEYGFGVSAGTGAAERVLTAVEFSNGRLDWSSVDLSKAPRLMGTNKPVPKKFSPMLPTPARFGGMPSDRFWEFEDARVNLAQVKAGPTDIGRLLLLEFALGYGNDWYVIPVTLPVGSLFTIKQFDVLDTFGVKTDVRRVANPGGERWRVFELTAALGTDPDSFLLAPAVDARLEGDALEETALFRDEMANMAWAVERKVPGSMGLPVDRSREATLVTASRRLSDLSGVEPQIIYRVATSVPPHWIPFVAVPAAGATPVNFNINLERRAMQKYQADGRVDPADPTVQPKGVLLRTDLTMAASKEPALRLEDEEVPREGLVLTRNAQFTRWIGGERLHWIGRRKRVGTGEGNSGLVFDTLVKKSDLAGG